MTDDLPMRDVPRKFIPHGERVVGSEPDPPTAGWAKGGISPTDADVCPYCDGLVESVNQHAGWQKDGSRWHRRCRLLSMGFVETDEQCERRYRWEGVIDAPDATIEVVIWAGTFIMRDWKTSVSADVTPTARDRDYLKNTQFENEAKEDASATAHRLLDNQQEGSR